MAGPIMNQSMSKIIPYIDSTHPGSGNNCSEARCSYQPFFRVVAEGDFPGNHQTAQAPLGNIVS
ncbi:MAG: hypothetical protein PQ964_02370, partial [Methanobacteriaceae archaeon]